MLSVISRGPLTVTGSFSSRITWHILSNVFVECVYTLSTSDSTDLVNSGEMVVTGASFHDPLK